MAKTERKNFPILGLKGIPLFVLPKQNELFSSWVYRLAHSNYCTPREFYKVYLGLKFNPKRDYDQIVPDEVIEAIKTLLHIEDTNILNCTMRYFENKLFPIQTSNKPNMWLLRQGLRSEGKMSPFLQYCPYCRKQHFETWYKLILFTICFDCGSELITNCIYCNQPINFFRLDTGKTIHAFDVEINTCHKCFKTIGNGKLERSSKRSLNLEIAWKKILLENNQDLNKKYFETLYRFAYNLQFIPFHYKEYLMNIIGIPVFKNERPNELCKLSIENRRTLFTLAGSLYPPDNYLSDFTYNPFA